jgi:ATP-dependent 26S proteasome regulatory subunit
MSTEEEISDWHEANRLYMMAALAELKEELRMLFPGESGSESLRHGEAKKNLESAGMMLSAPPALDALTSAFSLSPFERKMLLLCAGMELDSEFISLVGSVAEGTHFRPSFGLAMRLSGAHWTALSPDGPLRRWRLIMMERGETLTSSPLFINERLLHFLMGVSCLASELHGVVEPVALQPELPQSYVSLATKMASIWSLQDGETAVVQLCGRDEEAKKAIAARACFDLGLNPYAIHASDIPSSPGEREALICIWEREAILRRSALLIERIDEHDNRSLTEFLERTRGPLALITRDPLDLKGRLNFRLDVGSLSIEEQMNIWKRCLGQVCQNLDGRMEQVLSQFGLDFNGIREASARVLIENTLEKDFDAGISIWNACRSQSRPLLEDMAQRIEPRAFWDDLVLPATQMQMLMSIVSQVRYRSQVYERWGFASQSARGLGISALFAGESGTGKTMASEVLAGDLNLDLYRVDLSQVVSKYIGETEKNLRKIFDAAEGCGAILLFDEADALFGSRSEVKDSHDRYANIEVSYLLQRMEAYQGLAILTTNMKGALDKAFLRRIRFVVQFPFPDARSRARIWQRIFPRQTPLNELDFERLARLNVAGGNIRNIALCSAFLAAEDEGAVSMRHIIRAARAEYAKIERPLTEVDVGE